MSESETAEVVKTKGVKGVGDGHLSWNGSTPELAYHCRNLEDLRVALKHQIEQQNGGLVPELVVSRFQFGLDASLDPTEGVQQNGGAADAGPLAKDDSPEMNYSVPGALSNFFDQKDKLKYQRPIAKMITKAIQAADGFKYFERRCNDTSTSDGYRFFYICCDSIQNRFGSHRKLRHQGPQEPKNGDAGHADGENAENAEHKLSYKPKKDTFDCRGHFKVIFSIKHLCIDVLYRHLPIHRENTALHPVPTAQTTMPPEQPHVSDLPWPPPLPPNGHQTQDPDYQPEGTGKAKKRKRARPTTQETQAKAAAAALQANAAQTETAMASSAADAQNLNTLVDALQADMNGAGTADTHEGYVPAPPAHPSSSKQYQQPDGEAATPKQKKKKPSKGESLKQVDFLGRVVRVTSGCVTCRSRKKKCDERKPTCDNCSKSGRQCVYSE